MPDGILLVTGPTGSGKTTTLYSALHYMNKPDRKIITVEDPVEYQLSGINQVPVNANIGMTFPAALRSILRQAPNIIMIGEIRDLETASIAINASLTGHLVLSTLHTNDAPGAIARLTDIGIKPFLVSSSVRAVLAQRLVRRLCSQCKESGELTVYEARGLRIDAKQIAEGAVRKPSGCESCRGKGFKGRLGIFELFTIDDEVRHMIINDATTLQLRGRARELGHANAARGWSSQGARRIDHRRGSDEHHDDRRRIAMDPKQVAEIFAQAGWISPDQGHALAQEAVTTGKAIEEVMVDHGVVTEHQFFSLIAESLSTQLVDLDVFEGASHILHLIPAGLARLHGALPVGHADNTIYVALVDPLNAQITEDLRFALGREIEVVVAPCGKVRELISRHYGMEAFTMEDVLAQLGENTEVTLDAAGDEQFNAQAVVAGSQRGSDHSLR